MQYRRFQHAGGTWFFTVVTENRRPLFSDSGNVDLLRDVLKHVNIKYPMQIDAVVILPDHIHCIWTLPEGDSDNATRWRLIKSQFTKRCDSRYKAIPGPAKLKKQQQAVWQNRFWSHLITDDNDFQHHFDYIHYNPVKHGLCDKPVDWTHSSIHKFMASGVYPENWGSCGRIDLPENIGNE